MGETETSVAPVRARRVSPPKLVLAVAVLGVFMAFVDATIVNIAVPSIAQQFEAPLSSVSWVLNAYNIVFAAFLIGGGQLADLFGRRRVFSAALVVFTLASALCAAAPSLNFLIAARILQAAGAAALVPSSLAIVLEAHPAHERMHAVALWAAVAALAAGIGPPLGGLLITASSWRLVFLVNVPVGLCGFVLARRVLVESRNPGRRRMPDLLGGVVFALAIASLVLAVVKGEEWGWGNVRVVSALLASVLLGVYFVIRSGRQRVPVIDLSLLRIRAFALSNAVTIVMAAGFYSYTLCNVLFLTTVWRYSILSAGLALTPGPVMAMAIAGPASRLVGRVGHRVVIVPGALIWAGGMVFFATTLGVQPAFLSEWLPGMLILGVGAGMTFPTLSGAAVGSVPGARFAVATSLNSVARQLGAALGVAILIAIIGTPSPLEALHAFEHGWLFAAGCFLVGALACAGLVVARPDRAADDADGPAASADADRPAHPGPAAALPSLAESAGEHASVTPQSDAEFLCNIPLFAALPAAMREEIAELGSNVSVAQGEWLFRAGEPADALYVVRIGHLEVVQEGPQPGTLNTLTRGAVLGELALLTGSTRSASIRALRDSEVMRIEKAHFEALLQREPELALSLTRVLSAQLQASRAIPVPRRSRPVTIALRTLSAGVPLLELADGLSRALCAFGSVAVMYPDEQLHVAGESRAQASARFAPLIERCEQDHDQVLLLCSADGHSRAWDAFCLAHADRVLAIVEAAAPADPHAGLAESNGDLAWASGADLVGYDVTTGSGSLAGWVELLKPASVFALSPSTHEQDVARMARRLSARSLGVVLAGGGARAFAHLGVLEVLRGAGLEVDRVGGVSMGAFIGGLLAYGHDSDTIDAICFEEWVRRNPINDYTVPRAALIKGHKAEAMLERVFGDARLEELRRSFYCVSADLRGGRLVIDRDGPMFLTVGSSISLPLIAPPMRREQSLLIDGSLLDNLPLEPMSLSGEGPVLAIDIKGGEGPSRRRAAPGGEAPARERPRRLPSLPQTMGRIALLSSASTDESARRYADLTIPVRVPGVGLLEFHQIDAAREAGRVVARRMLEEGLPDWLTASARPASNVAGGRTVMRV